VNERPPDSVATEPLPPSILRLWRAVVLIETATLLAVAIVGGIAVSSPLILVGGVVVVSLLAGTHWWIVNLRYRNWRWGLDDRWIEQRSGVIIRTVQIVPRSRVQTLTTRTGPIDRWLGLSSIVVHTAGTATPNLTIPHLDQGTADQLRVELGA
jgi:uncharacterized protein